MSIISNLSKKVGEAASVAAKKSNELLEVTKINMSISSEEEKLKELFELLGKQVFEKYKQSGEFPEDFKSNFEEIKIHNDALIEFKQKVMELKKEKICPSCGSEADEDDAYCSKCGTKLE